MLAPATRYPCADMAISMSPVRSVRSTRTAASSSISSVCELGCPKSLPFPTLISASCGSHASNASHVRPFELPWWGTFSTSMGLSSRPVAIPSWASASASPASTMSNEPFATSNTTLVSFVFRSPEYPWGGQSTRTRVSPTCQTSPCPSRRRDGLGPSALPSPESAAGSDTPVHPTSTTPERAS